MADVGYNPNDPLQAGFLAALAQGETGGAANSAFTGTGGANLSGLSTDAFGFPSWMGLGNSHAAGTYQFQPGTWDAIASKFNLNFQNPSDQSTGAWYLAQQVYAQKTGGSLENALAAGQYSSIQSALAGTWTSVTGNQANPTGLASVLSSYISSASSASAATSSDSAGASAGSGVLTGAANWLNRLTGQPQTNSATAGLIGAAGGDVFARGGLILVGVVIIAAALWALLANQGVVPSPRQVARNL